MKTKFVPKSAILAMALASMTSVMAQTTLDKVAGYAPSGDNTVLTPSAIAADGSYSINLSKQFGVSFVEIPGLKPIRGPFKDVPTGKPVWHYVIPDGSTVNAMALGSEWGNMSEELAGVDIAKAKAKATSTGGVADFKFVKNDKPCLMYNWVVVDSAGNRFWGSHPDGSAWVVLNNNKSPRTGWCAKGNTVVNVDQFDKAIRVALAAKK